MDMTVRQRALAIEMNARQYAPATAVNALAVRVAQLEAACRELRAENAKLKADGWRAPVGVGGPLG